MAVTYNNALGRRKEAIARAYLAKGKGIITINGKDFKEYFPVMHLQAKIEQPFKVIESNEFDIKINVEGGGKKGQAEAVRLSIARALIDYNPEFRPALKKAKLLTRDSRVVERKKPGLRKARKRDQFSKR